ncbi:MAG: GAF domain-containing sensor histidine kinase, partial [Merismopedia sp. SIO2A8]|nr:GAF domain-containing sensor histidine kinase [Merismopedia sp. SIO2A8]
QCFELLEQLPHRQSYQVCLQTLRLSEPWHSVLVSPIKDDHGVVLGAMLVFRRCQESFTVAESRFLEQVTNQCAIAIRQSLLYQAAQKQVEELERLHQLKDDFLNTVSHELRTPMSTIHTAINGLEQQLSLGKLRRLDNPETLSQWQSVDQWLNLLRDSSQREMALIEDLLKLSHLESGTEPFVSSTLDLQAWLPHIVDVFRRQTQPQHQHISVDIVDTLPPLTTDFTLLERVVRELLQNAYKYTPADELIHISAKIDDIAPPVMILAVTNSGVSLPPKECERIFDKFYRVPKNDPWQHEGTGLGLALVRRLVEHLHGAIYATSTNQQVSLVIRLPLQPNPTHSLKSLS